MSSNSRQNKAGVFFEQAKRYHEKKRSIIPVHGKKAFTKYWTRGATELQPQELIETWMSEYPTAGLGLVLGPQSGVAALDLDLDLTDASDAALYERFRHLIPQSPVEKVGKKGFTRFFRFNAGNGSESLKLGNKTVIELLASGRQTVLPPSIHPDTGKPYTWTGAELLDVDPQDLPELPVNIIADIRRIVQGENPSVTKPASMPSSSANAGSGRNDSLKAQGIAAIYNGKGDELIVLELLGRDKKNSPPLFSDPSEQQMKGQSAAVNALRFVRSLRRTIGGALSSSAAAGSARVTIQTNSRQLRNMVRDANQALESYNKPPKIFRRDEQIVCLGKDKGGTFLERVSPDLMTLHMSYAADWAKINANSVTEVAPHPLVIKSLMTSLGGKLPRLNNLVATPFFSKSGRLIVAAGYHPDDEIYFAAPNGVTFATPSSSPSHQDLQQARCLLVEELLGDFPFASQTDQAHTLATLLLPFMRLMVDGPTPLHLFDASTPGSGKSLLADVITSVATGSPLVAQTLPGDDDELRKRVTSELTRGASLIVFDNAPNSAQGARNASYIDSPVLAAALTTMLWTDRILGRTEMATMTNKAIWLMTGNNVQLSMELARRTLRTRLAPSSGRPWERDGKTFRHPKLREWVNEHRLPLINAILTLIQGWIAAGKPLGDDTLGSYEAWSGQIGGVLEVAGVNGFLRNQADFYEAADAEGPEWSSFARACDEHFNGEPQRPGVLNDLCVKLGLMCAVRGEGSARSQVTRLGLALVAANDRIFGSLRVHLVADGGANGKTYVFQRIAAEAPYEPHARGHCLGQPSERPEKPVGFSAGSNLNNLRSNPNENKVGVNMRGATGEHATGHATAAVGTGSKVIEVLSGYSSNDDDNEFANCTSEEPSDPWALAEVDLASDLDIDGGAA